MVINFICRASKANKEGLSPLELSLIIDGVRRYITLDRKIVASTFNSKTQKVKKNQEVNDYLDAIRSKVYNQETEMIRQGITINIDTFVDIYKNGFTSNTITILQMFTKHNEQYKAKAANNVVSASTLSKYDVTKTYLASFISEKLGKKDVLVRDVTPKMVEDFYLYLLSQMGNNTAIQKMKQLKKMLRMAVDEAYIKVSPFKLVMKKDDVEVQPLTKEELRKIRNKEIGIERLEKVRDMFIFECYTGLAFSDMHRLQPEDFVTSPDGQEWIVKKRQKTKIVSTIPLLPVAKEILQKYDGQLPTLCNQKYNGFLKELGTICGIKKNLHSHLARHTFATILLNSGVDMVSVSKILGHANSRITEKVYAKMLPDTIMNKVKGVQANLI